MRTILCDKCGEQVGGGSVLARATDMHLNMVPREIDLCFKCATEFINWLEGETIDKQTKFPKFNIPSKETKP